MNEYFIANAVLSMFSKNYMELKKDLPIRPSEMAVLNIITETKGPHTPAKLAEFLKVSKPMITALITSLKNKGYVKKSPSRDDKRAYYVLPTEKAIDLVGNAKIDMNKHLDRLKNGMGKDDFEDFIRLSSVANDVLDNKNNKGE